MIQYYDLSVLHNTLSIHVRYITDTRIIHHFNTGLKAPQYGAKTTLLRAQRCAGRGQPDPARAAVACRGRIAIEPIHVDTEGSKAKGIERTLLWKGLCDRL